MKPVFTRGPKLLIRFKLLVSVCVCAYIHTTPSKWLSYHPKDKPHYHIKSLLWLKKNLLSYVFVIYIFEGFYQQRGGCCNGKIETYGLTQCRALESRRDCVNISLQIAFSQFTQCCKLTGGGVLWALVPFRIPNAAAATLQSIATNIAPDRMSIRIYVWHTSQHNHPTPLFRKKKKINNLIKCLRVF